MSSDNITDGDYDITDEGFGDEGMMTDVYELRWEQIGENGPAGEAASDGEDRGYPLEDTHYETIEQALESVPYVIESRQARGEERDGVVQGILDGGTGAVSGFKPSGPAHFGHYQTGRTLGELQEAGIEVYMPVADVEAVNDGVSPDDISHYSADNLIDWGAAGVNLDQAHVYLQSEEDRLEDGREDAGKFLDLATALDAYGFDKLEDNPLFMNVGLNQVADMTLPQHEDFGKDYSFMVSGSDQAGHMQAASTLVERALEADADPEKDFETHLNTGPGGLYCPEIQGLRSIDDTEKASSSEPETAIYIGPGRDGLLLEERIDTGLGKLQAALNEQPATVEQSSQDHLGVMSTPYEDGEATDILQQELPEFLEEHQDRRIQVFDYARDKAQGGNPEQPDFWPGNGAAQVPEEERNETEWHDVVAAMDGEVIE